MSSATERVASRQSVAPFASAKRSDRNCCTAAIDLAQDARGRSGHSVKLGCRRKAECSGGDGNAERSFASVIRRNEALY
jgi:hypothetical protein